jgi:predicted AlkP superfamily phosphohydrolase/phosphomutase
MTLPRWTVYPALMVIALGIFMAIPRRSARDPYADRGRYEPVVVLGIDGMDPDILKEVIARHPERMTNFQWLIARADGIQNLGTSTPPQSPVAWSNFITGMNPGGHGIFDFIHRDLVHRLPAPSTTKVVEGFELHLPGPYKIDVGADSPSNRSGEAFWTILRDHGVPADIWRIPANFPVEPSEGVSFSGMMTPALDSAYGQCTFFTTDPKRKTELRYDKTEGVQEYEGLIDTSIEGPPNPFLEKINGKDQHALLALKIYVDHEAEAAILYAGDPESEVEKVVLRPGQWSDFLRMDFDLLPLGMMKMSGICRFYLRSLSPNVELYASPVNFDPKDPVAPVSEPDDASAELTKKIGRYYTQGMAEDVNALKEGVLDDGEFMQQVTLIHHETMDMLDYALERYVEHGKQGFLFFYFSEIDLASHMMWRHGDEQHPAHDRELAKHDASTWTGREGSTLADTVEDMYMRVDPALGKVRERLGDDVTIIVMSDHGFAPFYREFSLNTWLVDNHYLVLKEGLQKERPKGDPEHAKVILTGNVDWSKTVAYGMGFNGLYLNLKGREEDDPETKNEDEAGIVDATQADAKLREIKAKLEAFVDPKTGKHPVFRCDLASDVYSGGRIAEAPDMLVGYDAGYGNSDASSTGRIPNEVLVDNSPANHGGHLGTFNGNHLMHPEVVPGLLLSNRKLREGSFKLQDLTVEILRRYGIEKPPAMEGRPVLE